MTTKFLTLVSRLLHREPRPIIEYQPPEITQEYIDRRERGFAPQFARTRLALKALREKEENNGR